MRNRVYYGEYSLKHWIELILKKNIILPEYQRYFVWRENKVKTLIETFKNKLFVPPITIGAFKNAGTEQNLILDGQQRLTSILLAYLGLFPDEATFKKAEADFTNDNDDEDEDKVELDNVFEWTFDKLTEKGKNKESILANIIDGNYKIIDFGIDNEFLKSTFLGFSYLVPYVSDERIQQKYYSSVFRNINIQGQALLPQESRASLYYLDENLAQFFDPDFCKDIKIKNSGNETKLDFVRYLSLLSQYHKDSNPGRIARGYKPIMEKYYEKFIYSVAEEDSDTHTFARFSVVFPDKNYVVRYEKLKQSIVSLGINNHQFISIIDLDIFFFGLIYVIAFRNKEIDTTKINELKIKLERKIEQLKNDLSHKRAPGALKYLRLRIESSIAIYNRFTI